MDDISKIVSTVPSLPYIHTYIHTCLQKCVLSHSFGRLNLCFVFILGILKAVHGTQSYHHNRVTKDVVAFYAGDFPDLVEKLQLDLHEPPISQVK
jgi:hypothetical protein